MKPSGLLLMVAGVWVLCQVLGGDALGRLGISGASTNNLPPNASTPVGPIAGNAAGAAAGAAVGGALGARGGH